MKPALTKQGVIDIIATYIKENGNDKISVNENTCLYPDADLDSLDMVDLVMTLEKAYKISLSADDVKNLDAKERVGEYADYFFKCLSKYKWNLSQKQANDQKSNPNTKVFGVKQKTLRFVQVLSDTLSNHR